MKTSSKVSRSRKNNNAHAVIDTIHLMKQNKVTYIVSAALIIAFLLLLFVYQVRTTQVAVKTTFGKPTAVRTNAGAYFKWPWPIQQVHHYDNRFQNFEVTYDETFTQDGYPIMTKIFVSWRIASPKEFLQSFSGLQDRAQEKLEGLLSEAKNSVVSSHPFAHFISAEEEAVQLTQMENEILEQVHDQALKRFGIEVGFLGFNQLGVPESVTTNVFSRMEAERQKAINRLRGEGEQVAMEVRSKAQSKRSEILAEARAEATRIRGRADAIAAEQYKVFEKNPQFAELILKLNSLERSLQERSTLILDERTVPFDLLIKGAKATTRTNLPESGSGTASDIAKGKEE